MRGRNDHLPVDKMEGVDRIKQVAFGVLSNCIFRQLHTISKLLQNTEPIIITR